MRAALVVIALTAVAAGAEAPPAPKLTRPPKLKRYVPAVYPESARQSAREATVTLSLSLDATGHVTEASVTSSPDPDFDPPAIAAALQLEFEPAEIDGQPAPVRIGFRYRFALEAPPPPPRTFHFRVTVLDDQGQSVSGAQIRLKPSGQTGLTDAGGEAAFEGLPAGVYVVSVEASGLVSVAEELSLDGDLKRELRLKRRKRARGVDEELIIRVPKTRRDPGATAIAADEARHVAGVMGDALAVVQNLPGVARPAAGSGAVVVWGAAPAETRVYVDDVPVPYLYHQGGLRAVVNDWLVSSIELTPGGYGAEYGRATGGLLKVTTSSPARDGVSGYVGADGLDGSGAVAYRQSAESGPLSVSAGGRYGWVDKLLPLISHDVQRTVPLPQYGDYLAKVMLRGDHSTTQLFVLGASDALDRTFANGGVDHTSTSFHRLAVRHERALPEGASAVALLWGGVDQSALRWTFRQSDAAQDSTSYRGGARFLFKQPLEEHVTLKLGADLEAGRVLLTRQGTLGLPPHEGDPIVYGQPPSDQVAFERWTEHRLGLGAFVEVPLSLGRLTLTPGLRVEPFVLEGERKLPPSAVGVDFGYSRVMWWPEPRLAAQLKVTNDFELTASGGLYHQAPEPADLSAVFGNPSLGASTGAHAVLSSFARLFGRVQLEAAAFYKAQSGLTVRSTLDAPKVAQALVDTGEGRGYGAQLVVRPLGLKRFSGWLSYSLQRAERRDGPDAAWRLFDFDQTHVLTAVASVELPLGFRLGGRLRVASGYPRTPVTGAYYDARLDVFEPVRGAVNSERLPTFAQLDLRAEHTGHLGPLSYGLFVDLINVTGAKNAEEVVYSYDYRDRQYLTGLPFFAMLGARLEL